MARDNVGVVGADQLTGFVKPNSRIGGGDLLDLLGRVGAGIVRVRHKVGGPVWREHQRRSERLA